MQLDKACANTIWWSYNHLYKTPGKFLVNWSFLPKKKFFFSFSSWPFLFIDQFKYIKYVIVLPSNWIGQRSKEKNKMKIDATSRSLMI